MATWSSNSSTLEGSLSWRCSHVDGLNRRHWVEQLEKLWTFPFNLGWDIEERLVAG